jgi:hypothetical protein
LVTALLGLKEGLLVGIVEATMKADKAVILKSVEKLGIAARYGFVEQSRTVEIAADEEGFTKPVCQKVRDNVQEPDIRIQRELDPCKITALHKFALDWKRRVVDRDDQSRGTVRE